MIDLNKQRAARKREGNKEAVEVKLGRETFSFPVELPFDAVMKLASISEAEGMDVITQMTEVLRGLLGDTQFEKFQKQSPSIEDVMALVEALMSEYGTTLGGSSVSPKSSRTTTTPARPRSKQSTG
jgi:hypothetical protein